MNSLLDELQGLSDWKYRMKFAQIVDDMEDAIGDVVTVDRTLVAYMVFRECYERYQDPTRFGWSTRNLARDCYAWQAFRVITLGLDWRDKELAKSLVRHILCDDLVPTKTIA